jgi:expansin (peptidoglycan-binding protein)
VRVGLVLFLAACGAHMGVASSDGNGTSDGGGSGPRALGPPQQGDATYYNADGSGNCSFDPSPNDLNVAAMNAPEYANSAVCGECVAITGPKGSVTVRIVDQCPGCPSGDLDLSMQAFEKIADLAAGRVMITWNVVTCEVSGPVAYRFKEGSSQYWTAIQVRNHRVPVAKLEWQNGGSFVDVARQSYNYFVEANGVGTGPVVVRLTSSDGQMLTDTLAAGWSAGSVVAGAGQFQ